ncbi:MAG: serine hydrolase [Gemmatimonadota bacterium]|nr:serine hydrolase [Gemmatimonadota bacterium]
MIRRNDEPEQIGLCGEGIRSAYGILEEAVVRGELMGAALQVSRGGVALPPACFGRRTLAADGSPVEPDTRFLVASITKPIVAAAVMSLVERGKVCLDDPVPDIVPEFGQAGKEGVQVRHLLTHTSGLPDMLPQNLALRAEHAPLEVFIQHICRVELLFDPGTRISYQSCGIAMLGEIVQRVEAVPIRTFLKRSFFDPLGLADTTLGSTNRCPRESEVKIRSGEYGAADAVSWNWNSDYWRGFGAPWGGLVTTTAEMTALCQAFLFGGSLNGIRILQPATVAAMTADQTSAMPDLNRADRFRQRWGLGWRLRDRMSSIFGDLTSDATFGHEGATGTVAWVDPETETTCVLFSNDPQGAAPLRPRVGNAVAASVM